ncbi:MAG: response regulator [Bacteroidales bacterium]|nr:response regulator [Bacteroidales bacterium]
MHNYLKYKINITTLFLLFFLSSYSFPIESFILTNQEFVNFVKYIEIFEDTSKNHTIATISSITAFNKDKLKKNKKEIHFDFNNSIFWLKFKIINKNNYNKTMVLEIKNPTINKIQLFEKHKNKILETNITGDALHFNTRQIKNRNFIYELNLKPNSEYEYYLSIESEGDALNIPVFLYSQSAFICKIGNSNIFNGLFYGIILAILITTFIFWIVNLRQKDSLFYIWFFVYVFFVGLFNLNIDGFAFQYIWPGSPWLTNNMIIALPMIGWFCLARFTNEFFEIKKNNKNLHSFISILSYIIIIFVIISFTNILNLKTQIFLVIVFSMLLLIVINYTAILFFKYNKKLSSYFILAFLALIISAIVIFTNIYFGSFNYIIRDFAMKIGMALQVIILLIALSIRIKIKQDNIYNKSIKKIKELKEAAKIELEKKVIDRTLLVTESKNKLEEAYKLINQKNKDLEKSFKKSSNHYIKLQKALILINKQKQNLENANIEIKESTRLKEIFLANTSHEIRTPLNAIAGFTNLLLKTILSPKQISYLKNIKASGDNLLVVINDILDFSKIEAGKLKIEKVEFNIFDLVDNVISTFNVKTDEKNIDLIYKIDQNIPEILVGDPVRLNQILINLIGNAIKFTGTKGKIKLLINLRSGNDNFDIVFKVIDTGIGIAKENINVIFDSFTQAERNTTRKYGGSGLGLTIVKQLIDLQNGNISVESEINKGTTFTFNLIFGKVKEKLQEPIKEKDIIFEKDNLLDLNILVVEDNEINQQLAIDTIDSWEQNIKVDIANNGIDAIKKIEDNDYHLILMDIQMPQMDGIETSIHIRKKLPHPKNKIPIIAMTAHTMEDEKDNCLKIGINDYISKPFNPDELYVKIKLFTNQDNENVLKKEIPAHDKFIDNNISNQKYTKSFKNSIQVIQETKLKFIKLDKLNKIYKSDLKKIKKIIKLYLISIPGEIEELDRAIEDKNWEIVKNVAHTLKPKMIYLGLKNLHNYSKTIEINARNQENIEKIPDLLNKIKDNWIFIEKDLDEILNA